MFCSCCHSGWQSVLPQGCKSFSPVAQARIWSAVVGMGLVAFGTGGSPLFSRMARRSWLVAQSFIDDSIDAQCSSIWFFSQPGIVNTMLYFPSGSSAFWGSLGIAFYEGEDVFGDGHVVAVG